MSRDLKEVERTFWELEREVKYGIFTPSQHGPAVQKVYFSKPRSCIVLLNRSVETPFDIQPDKVTFEADGSAKGERFTYEHVESNIFRLTITMKSSQDYIIYVRE